jgi:hypothetical protein
MSNMDKESKRLVVLDQTGRNAIVTAQVDGLEAGNVVVMEGELQIPYSKFSIG